MGVGGKVMIHWPFVSLQVFPSLLHHAVRRDHMASDQPPVLLLQEQVSTPSNLAGWQKQSGIAGPLENVVRPPTTKAFQ